MAATDISPRTDSVVVPPGAILSRADSRIIWLLLGAAFVAILNEMTMGVAIPHLITDLGITAVAAQWLTTAFMLTMAVVIPISGFLLQRFTTRAVFVTAMGLFSLGTLIAFVSPGFPLLLVARVVQASGTAIMMPLLMTTLMTLVPAHSRGRMMGRVSVVMSLAPAIGPTLSGLLLDTVGWRWIFGIVLPIALIALAVGARWIHNLGEPTRVAIDVPSIILSALGFGGLVFGLSQIGGPAAHGGGAAAAAAADALSTTTLVVSFSVGAVALALFVWRQLRMQRTDRALLDLRVFRSLNFSLSIAQMLLLSLSFFGTLTVVPLYLQTVLRVSALETGLILLPGALAMGLAGPLIGRVYDRWGTRVLLIPGSFIAVAMLWTFTSFDQFTPIWVIAVSQTVLSIGLALSLTPLFTASLASLQPRFYSYGSAVLGTMQQVGGAAGIALMITILSGVRDTAIGRGLSEAAAGAAGAQAAFTIAAIAALPLIVGAFLIRKPVDGISAPIAMH
ncbi:MULTISPECIES: DHA2 family efflux MFS transporter permease subunit [unclassified Microbacterium]|uniref:DHA2 family efflux MFS transporter permease subunit n=1 Tax=unclassified Microbacterium TaxID=2609290 RepID=UPI00214BA85C|nr:MULTISPECIES: DHA2 family efflux MFS transporter permease subunit [unclassified Microbacterium]MCR2809738.1 DHA2 family efflux MFS transporter permease subunit [Microbacterium sp. zg.B185]WIM17946.1 DHA2 family efflux MFS transporter permease subunit [Microbacterium sp. zg-B185]